MDKVGERGFRKGLEGEHKGLGPHYWSVVRAVGDDHRQTAVHTGTGRVLVEVAAVKWSDIDEC